MAKVLKVIGIIGFVVVGFFGMIAMVAAVGRSGFAGILAVLLACLIDCIVPALFYGLGSVLEDNAEMRRNSYATAASIQSRQNKNMWNCECGRGNADYVAICNCGRRKPTSVNPRDQAMNDLYALLGVKPVEHKTVATVNREKQDSEIVAAGGWKCSCGRANHSYVSTCACGKGRHEMDR